MPRVVSLVLGWASVQYIEQTGFLVARQVGRVGVSFMPRLGHHTEEVWSGGQA